MAPDTSATEDELVRHQMWESPLVLERLDALVWRNERPGKPGRVDWGRRDGLWDFWGRGEPGKWTTFEM